MCVCMLLLNRQRNKAAVWNMQSVNDVLKVHGVKNVKRVSKCLRAGILEQHVKILPPEDDPKGKYGLDQVSTIQYRLHHGVEVGMGYTQRRVKGQRRV